MYERRQDHEHHETGGAVLYPADSVFACPDPESCTVPGDSERTVGQVVKFQLPSPQPPIDNKQVDDKYYSGKFLVTAVRHKIDNKQYMTTMDLVKDSTFTRFP